MVKRSAKSSHSLLEDTDPVFA